MPNHRTHLKRERDPDSPPPADNDDYRHRHHERSRSPRRSPPRERYRVPPDSDNYSRVLDGPGPRGKVEIKREEGEEEKDFLVRKRVKEGEHSHQGNVPSWLYWVAGAALIREDRKKHKYSVEKRGTGKDKGKGKNRDDDDDGSHAAERQTGRAYMERLDTKMEEILELPDDVQEAMRRETARRHRDAKNSNFRERYPGRLPLPDYLNDEYESVYERYMRTRPRENP
ncbi:hypothetical protein N0V85_007064 [Neurospora sp. IMI 360204]|nr:hypothetical protein N0V85_007064 [Neurospora sp. IMI 360204]